MKKPLFYTALGAAAALVVMTGMTAIVSPGADKAEAASENLAVVWTSADPDVAHRMTLMYTHAAKTQEWFDEVTLIVWGPSQRLLAADKDIQEKFAEMADDGVVLQACIVCAESYGLTERLEELELEVKGMGAPLSGHIKSDTHVITF